MDSEVTDLTEMNQPKSDQLNADDLRAGSMVVTFKRITKGKDRKQPLAIQLEEFRRGPWRPCLSERRIMSELWGKNPAEWPNFIMVELWRNPDVMYGGEAVGGIQICGAYPLPAREVHVSRTMSRGLKVPGVIRRLDPPKQQPQRQQRATGKPTADLAAFLAEANVSTAEVDAWLATQNKPPIADLDDTKRAAFASWLASNPAKVQAIRDLAGPGQDDPEPPADEPADADF